jgi:hypothetical protein
MSVFSPTPTTVEQAIAPFKKVQENLKAVRSAQKKKASDAQSKIDTARRALETTEKAESTVINAATSEDVAATRLLEKLDALLSPDVPDVGSMKPAQKANAGHTQNKA